MIFLFAHNLLIMSSGIGAIERTKSLTPSLSTHDKPSSIDISTSSSELTPKTSSLINATTLPSEQSQTKGRLIVLTILINVSVDFSKPFIDNKYVAQIVYEDKVMVLTG